MAVITASQTYRTGSRRSALTGLFIRALDIEPALEPFSRKHRVAGAASSAGA